MEQDWAIGDFSTWIDHSVHMQAFGVSLSVAEVLDMVDLEQRAVLARELSVAGNPAWVSAMDARSVAYKQMHFTATTAEMTILEQAKLGFIAARAVLAQAATRQGSAWLWEEREWDIPIWFWQEFALSGRSEQDWITGCFSGRGSGPHEIGAVTLSDVRFSKASLAAAGLAPLDSEPAAEPAKRGRKPQYDWDVAAAAVWGQIYRGDLQPQTQAELEKAFIRLLTKGGKEPSESTVRPFASRIWDEISKA